MTQIDMDPRLAALMLSSAALNLSLYGVYIGGVSALAGPIMGLALLTMAFDAMSRWLRERREKSTP